jgi:outer membrane protein assembly factor BamD (BamD/ComL family)
VNPKESLFIQGLKKIKADKLKEAEKNLKKVVKKGLPQSEKAEILLAAIQIRKECERLLKEIG